ncbi:MAG: hypothetical protein WC393_01975 [Candidatus Nanoarchaeia archaeon]|jgi:hypothetical protein
MELVVKNINEEEYKTLNLVLSNYFKDSQFEVSCIYEARNKVFKVYNKNTNKTYNLTKTKYGNMKKSNDQISKQEAKKRFFERNNLLLEYCVSSSNASTPKYYKTLEGKTGFEDAENDWLLREWVEGYDLEELIGGFLKSNNKDFDEYVFELLKIDKTYYNFDKKKSIIFNTLGEIISGFHNKTIEFESNDEYYSEHLRRLKNFAREDEIEEIKKNNPPNVSVISLGDLRTRNIVISKTKNNKLMINLIDTDGMLKANPSIDYDYFDQDTLEIDWQRIYHFNCNEDLNSSNAKAKTENEIQDIDFEQIKKIKDLSFQASHSFNKYYFNKINKKIKQEFYHYPYMTKLKLSNISYFKEVKKIEIPFEKEFLINEKEKYYKNKSKKLIISPLIISN